ncbi:hypothetical protein ES703_55616 [subsurface metagenome]
MKVGKYKKIKKPIRKTNKKNKTQKKIPWQTAVKIIKPHVVKIITPRGAGTGFLCAYSPDKKMCGIATAAHVVEQSDLWEEPIRLYHYSTKKSYIYRVKERVIYLDKNQDSAVIMIKNDALLPITPLNFIRVERHIKVGVEIGWVGFPAVSPNELCFFTGRISSWGKQFRTYLVDGVAINGVSGGPAFHIEHQNIQVIGAVSAYLPNRVGATPGLAVISNVDAYQNVIEALKDWDEAMKKKENPPSDVNSNQ